MFAPKIAINEGLVLEYGLVMRSFEDGFFIAFLRRVLINLRLVPSLAFISLALCSVLTGGIEAEMIVGCVIAGPFMHPVALEKFALTLVMKFVLL